jgi:hypothetical protein
MPQKCASHRREPLTHLDVGYQYQTQAIQLLVVLVRTDMSCTRLSFAVICLCSLGGVEATLLLLPPLL